MEGISKEHAFDQGDNYQKHLEHDSNTTSGNQQQHIDPQKWLLEGQQYQQLSTSLILHKENNAR